MYLRRISSLTYNSTIRDGILRGNEPHLAVALFCHKYHPVAFDAAYGARLEIGKDTYLLACHLFRSIVLGDARNDDSLVEPGVDGKLEQLVGLGNPFCLQDSGRTYVHLLEILEHAGIFLSGNLLCLFCRSGRESVLIARLAKAGYPATSPLARRVFIGPKDRHDDLRCLLPGYVFFESPDEPDWDSIRRIPEVYRVLAYADGSRSLRGHDLEFVAWLKQFEGVIEISKAVRIGTRVHFIDGPLREMNGRVKAVNRKRSVAAITFGDDGSLLGTVWCSMDIVASYAETEVPEEYRDALTQS